MTSPSPKIDHHVYDEAKRSPGPYSVMVRFDHRVTDQDVASLPLSPAGDQATGQLTLDEIERLAQRADVVAIRLMQTHHLH